MTKQILSQPDCNFLGHLAQEQQEKIQGDLNVLILATDMSRHEEILSKFKGSDNLTYLKMILIKACDVSNEIRPTYISEPWVEKLLQEYFCQCQLEKKRGLPFAPFMDPDQVTKSASQIGFIRFVLLPLFESLSKVSNHFNVDNS